MNDDRALLEAAARAYGFVDDAITPDDDEHDLHRDEHGSFYWVDVDGWIRLRRPFRYFVSPVHHARLAAADAQKGAV